MQTLGLLEGIGGAPLVFFECPKISTYVKNYRTLNRIMDIVSYKATKQKNVPAFIQTPNNEEISKTLSLALESRHSQV